MAFPQVLGDAGNSNTNATTRNIALPLSVNSGDLLLLMFVNDGSATASVTTPATGWSEVGTASSSSAVRLTALARIADGTEGGTSITVTTSATERSAWVIYQITGWYGSDLSNNVAWASTTGTSSTPNPPSLNPAGWDTEDTLWIATYGWDGNVSHSAYPSNYLVTRLTSRAADTAGCGAAAAGRELNAASADPGSATISASEQWVAATIAVRPASPIVAVDANATGTSVVTGVGAAIAGRVAQATGSSTVLGAAADLFAATGVASGQAIVAGATAALSEATGSATGSSTVAGIGDVVIPPSVAEAVGTSLVAGLGATLVPVNAIANSVSVASGIGSATATTTALADGSCAVTGASGEIAIVVGAAIGTATVFGMSGAITPTTGSATGTATVLGASYIAQEGLGRSGGLAIVTGISDALYPTPGDAGNSWTYVQPRLPKSWGGVTDATTEIWTPLTPTSSSWSALNAVGTTTWSPVTSDPDTPVWSNVSLVSAP